LSIFASATTNRFAYSSEACAIHRQISKQLAFVEETETDYVLDFLLFVYRTNK
jgi:hypothetical protein